MSARKRTKAELALTMLRLHKCRCTACDLCLHRDRVVLGATPAPVPIIAIGEAPGRTEDVRGLPFVGPAGKILRWLIDRAGLTDKVYITNTVSCLPLEDGVLRPPTELEQQRCYETVQAEIHRLVKPTYWLAIGRSAEAACKRLYDIPPENLYHIVHPSFLLRRYGHAYERSRECRAAFETLVNLKTEIEHAHS